MNSNPIDKEDQDDADERSVFVKNVDYSAEPAELKDHFKECGEVKRVTIPVDKVSQ
jgi:RNA recognition motif-containing protein